MGTRIRLSLVADGVLIASGVLIANLSTITHTLHPTPHTPHPIPLFYYPTG
ncbi:MAG: hypothetical protein KME27_07445 [Lyngbya sp. HA4199-MV5]|nr:hypothetical protein [Lyngbya sp. HA4199-MV5]